MPIRSMTKHFQLIISLILLAAVAISGVVRADNPDPNAVVRGEYILRYDLTSRGPKYGAGFGLPEDWGKGICPAFTANLNQFRQLDFNTCNPRLSHKFPRFSRPQWEQIPFSMALAKQIKDRTHSWWEGWLNSTAAARARGEVRMWRLRADILGNGEPQTLVRLDHSQFGYPPPSCSYYDSDQMFVETDRAIPKAYALPLLAMLSVLGNDLIYDSDSKRYYFLEWNRSGPAHADGEDAYIFGYRYGAARPSIGATAGVVLYTPTVRGAIPTCWIDWVPNGSRKPGMNNPKR